MSEQQQKYQFSGNDDLNHPKMMIFSALYEVKSL